MEITVIGSGAMGAAITMPLADARNIVNLWGTEFDLKILESIQKTRIHPVLKASIPDTVRVFYPEALKDSVSNCEALFIAVVSDAMKDIILRVLPFIGERCKYIVILSKGLYEENGKVLTLSKIVYDKLEEMKNKNIEVVVVGGPCIAEELVRKVYTVAIYASRDIAKMSQLKDVCETNYYKISLTDDVIGVELCAALKNVYAIAVGWCDGLEETHRDTTLNNLKSYLMTQAVKEMAEISRMIGARSATSYGSAVLADLDVTIRKLGGRHVLVGRFLGAGMGVNEALNKMREMGKGTIEGYFTIGKVIKLITNSIGTETLEKLPLLRATYEVLFRNLKVEDALYSLFENLGE